MVYADKKGVNLSRVSHLIENDKKNQASRVIEAKGYNLNASIVVVLFALFVAVDILSSHLIGVKAVIALLLVGVLGKMLLSSRNSADCNNNSPNLSIKDNFNIKAVTYLVGTPEEISFALIDEKLRPLWDPRIKSI